MSCEPVTFNHKADIYYATMEQVVTGGIEKTWTLEHEGFLCELSSDKFNSDTRYAISMKNEFLRFPLLVFGRFHKDIRLGNDGHYRPITSIMINNVRTACNDKPIFIEAAEGEVSEHTTIMFEIRTFEPFTDPWGEIEYYKTQAFRMDDQDEPYL